MKRDTHSENNASPTTSWCWFLFNAALQLTVSWLALLQMQLRKRSWGKLVLRELDLVAGSYKWVPVTTWCESLFSFCFKMPYNSTLLQRSMFPQKKDLILNFWCLMKLLINSFVSIKRCELDFYTKLEYRIKHLRITDGNMANDPQTLWPSNTSCSWGLKEFRLSCLTN